MKGWMKVVLGIGSHWFFIYLPIFFGLIFFFVIRIPKAPFGPPPFVFLGGFVVLMVIHLFSIFAMLGIQGIFLAYVAKHPRFTPNERVLWVLLLAFLNILVLPIFFWMRFRQHPVGEPFFGPKELP
jgi:hypothetical protein